MILILGTPQDEHASAVAAKLKSMGSRVEFLSTDDFPRQLQISFDPKAGTGFFVFPSGTEVNFSDIKTVYWRNFGEVGRSALQHLYEREQAYIAQNDSRGLFESVLLHLKARWVNGWSGFQMHQRKPAALAKIAALGISTPATLMSNHPEEVKKFVSAHGECIFKPIQGGAHTKSIKPEDLCEERLKTLQICPVTIQERVPGTNLRVFVIGNEVLVCELDTNELDFREDEQLKVKAIEPDAELKALSLKAADALHLVWSGIDFIRTPEGKYVFLEANPSPMFLGFQKLTGLPILEKLCAYLAHRSSSQ